jgi:hypothetical protein
MKRLILCLMTLMLFALLIPAASATVYTEYSAWLAATPGDHDAFGTPQNLGDLGVTTSTGSFGAPRGVFTSTYVWNDRVVLGGTSTVFYDGDRDGNVPYYAFGGFWDFSPGGDGDGLLLTLSNGQSWDICGYSYVGGCTVIPEGSFFGVVTSPFTTLTISAGNQPEVAETFDLSALDMVHPTPEPSSMLLLGSGLLGAARIIRRKLVR